MIYEKIDLISEMLDATLNLKCFCIKGLNDDLSFIKELMLPIFVDNNKEKDKFRDMLFNMEEEHVYLLDNLILGNYFTLILLTQNINLYIDIIILCPLLIKVKLHLLYL